MEFNTVQKTACYHCGESCDNNVTIANNKTFCCKGCLMVYDILSKNGLCNYYELAANPGSSQKISVRKDKFSFLDHERITSTLISFTDNQQTRLTFYLPQIHCSSCLWLLENLHKLNPYIISSKVNFARREVDIAFSNTQITLRQVAGLLTSIGYEPYISLSDTNRVKPSVNRSMIYKLGVAGFCFFNIMLLSFPDYLGIDDSDKSLLSTFRYLAVLLSLPVVFYSATEFYNTAWKSLTHRFLSIDTPIVIAIWVTFARSMYEVFWGSGVGYFDSMSGIVFFMLIGRMLQQKTYDTLNFDRDYTSYFPIAVTKLHNGGEETIALPGIALNDTLLIHSHELIPADGILTRGTALIDYSFVTGESMPVYKQMGEIVYAGGKQTGSNIELLVIKPVAQSYLTKLWNQADKSTADAGNASFVHLISRYFTWVVFAIAGITLLYWAYSNPLKMWSSFTAVLIIACPCALLLSNAFTNGNLLRILGRNKFYLRNAQTIENIGKADHIVFDKTGTLTTSQQVQIEYVGNQLSASQKLQVAAVASQSIHPMSKGIAAFLGGGNQSRVAGFTEIPGKGIEAIASGNLVTLGAKSFVMPGSTHSEASAVYVAIENEVLGKFVFHNQYRNQVPEMVHLLQKRFPVSVLSGDNDGEKYYLTKLLGANAQIKFNQSPTDKLENIKTLQQKGKTVIMLGDGLNDAGALTQADVGIAVSDSANNFTPASNAIIHANMLSKLHKFIKLCKINRLIVLVSFAVSILYNLVGLFFAVQGSLSPVIAAILMPASSLSVLLITFGSGNLAAWRLGLR